MIVAQDTETPAATPAEAAVAVAESAAALPGWLLIIVMGLAVTLAGRPRKDPGDRLGG